MATKEQIQEEIEKIPDEYLDEFYDVIRAFLNAKTTRTQSGILSRLSQIKIQGPEDFSSNVDLYLIGEKKIDGE